MAGIVVRRPRMDIGQVSDDEKGSRTLEVAPKEPCSTTDRNVMAVNSATRRASNREAREAEAEQDRILIEQAQGGDERAFRQLVERHQRRAFAIAIGLVRDEQDALEVVQEAFLRVHKGLATFHGGSS